MMFESEMSIDRNLISPQISKLSIFLKGIFDLLTVKLGGKPIMISVWLYTICVWNQ